MSWICDKTERRLLACLVVLLALAACSTAPTAVVQPGPTANAVPLVVGSPVEAAAARTYEYRIDVEDFTSQCISNQDQDLLTKQSASYQQESGAASITAPSAEAMAAAKKAQQCINTALQDSMNKSGQQGWHVVNFTSSPADPPLDEYGLETIYRIIWER